MVNSEGVFEGGEGAEDECYWMEGKGNRREVGGMSVGGSRGREKGGVLARCFDGFRKRLRSCG